MERRFVRVWKDIEARISRGESLHDIMRETPSHDLVAAVAVAGAYDAVAANAIATELLNRLRRAPYLGACLVSVTMVVAIVVLDYALTGELLFIASGPLARILLGISVALAVASSLMFHMWRGGLPHVRARLERRRPGF